MDVKTFILALLVLMGIAAGLLVVVAERRRKKELRRAFNSVNLGDVYTRIYTSHSYPQEVIVDRVVIVGKFVNPSGEPWISYEYENEQTPYDVPFEDFIERFVKIENNPTSH